MAGEETPSPGRRWDSARLALVVGAGAIVVSLLVLTALFMRSSSRRLQSENPSGNPAPAFALPLVGGGSTDFRSHLGNPVVLNFWASWCHTCKQEAPVLAAGWKRWGTQGVHFVGVNTDDGETWAQQFMRQYGLSYPVYLDKLGQVERLYGLTGHPETFFIGRDGRIKAKYVGPVDPATLERLISTIAVS